MKAEELGFLLDTLKSRGLLDRTQQLAVAGDGGITLLLWPDMPKQHEPTAEEAFEEYQRAQYGAS